MRLAERVQAAMQGAGIKARTFAALVGCHYTTIYDLLRKETLVPLPVMQKNIYDVLDFLESATRDKRLPLNDELSATQKNLEITQMYSAHKIRS